MYRHLPSPCITPLCLEGVTIYIHNWTMYDTVAGLLGKPGDKVPLTPMYFLSGWFNEWTGHAGLARPVNW